MKHPASTVILLLALFIAAQLIGLFVLDSYIDSESTAAAGVTIYRELPAGIERPDVSPIRAVFFITAAIVIGTVALLLIMKFRQFNLWRIWYFLAVSLSLSVAFAAFIPNVAAGIVGIAASVLKVFRPNFLVHNATELFIYAGLAAIFVPVLNVMAAAALLILISLYDMYAVWRSRHMVRMAKFQASSNLFAGLSIPKAMPKTASTAVGKVQKAGKPGNVAIIGGGDIGFPLIFAGAIMAEFGFGYSLIIPAFASLGLLFLFIISKKNKFYPAMPFVSAGCFLGYSVLLLV